MALVSADGGRNNTESLVYDEKKGTWTAISATSNSSTKSSPTTSTTPAKTDTESVDTKSSNVDSKTEADKEYIEAEFNVLTGDLVLTSTEKSIRLKVNDTVKIEGLGKYLSGLYFVSAIRRSLTKDGGYSHTLSLIKNGFGSSVKKAQPVVVEPVPERKEEVPKEAPAIKKGDSVRIVGDDAVYSNAHDGVKVPKWVKQKTLTVSQLSSDGTRALLKEIYSWTYIKYLERV